MMKGGRQGDGVTAPHKLRQFLTNLAAIVTGPSNLAALLTEPSDTRRATKKQIQQLGERSWTTGEWSPNSIHIRRSEWR